MPTETPALDDAEEGHFDEESGWGLDDDEAHIEDETLPTATSALDVAEEGHSLVDYDARDREVPVPEDHSIQQPPVEEIALVDDERGAMTPTPVAPPITALPTATPVLEDVESGLDPKLRVEPESETEILPTATPALEEAEQGQPSEHALDAAAREGPEEDAAEASEPSDDLASPVGSLPDMIVTAGQEPTDVSSIVLLQSARVFRSDCRPRSASSRGSRGSRLIAGIGYGN